MSRPERSQSSQAACAVKSAQKDVDEMRGPGVGEIVMYWQHSDDAEALRPVPSIVIEKTPLGEGWSLTVFQLGYVSHRTGVMMSDEPKAGCFTVIRK